MGGEPRNAAVKSVAEFLTRLNDRDFFVNEGLSLVTTDFVRYDERRLTAHPTADAQAWLNAAIELEEVAGEWPRTELGDVVAVRGDRLFAVELVTRLADRALTMASIVVARVDEGHRRFEALYYFDAEDVDRAIAQLDTLHAEINTEHRDIRSQP